MIATLVVVMDPIGRVGGREFTRREVPFVTSLLTSRCSRNFLRYHECVPEVPGMHDINNLYQVPFGQLLAYLLLRP